MIIALAIGWFAVFALLGFGAWHEDEQYASLGMVFGGVVTVASIAWLVGQS